MERLVKAKPRDCRQGRGYDLTSVENAGKAKGFALSRTEPLKTTDKDVLKGFDLEVDLPKPPPKDEVQPEKDIVTKSKIDGHFLYMARQLRIEYEGAFYHVTSRGN